MNQTDKVLKFADEVNKTAKETIEFFDAQKDKPILAGNIREVIQRYKIVSARRLP